MANYFYGVSQQTMQNPHPVAQSIHHHGRSRRHQRPAAQQPHSRQFRHQPKQPEKLVVTENPAITAFRARFEAGRSFDLDDDLEFCPNLLSFDERQSVTSGSSDRSSLSSGSPENSPLQHQIQPQQITPALSLSSAATASYISPPTAFAHQHAMKMHQPSPIRQRGSAIPIINPATNTRISSPPSSISPSMMQHAAARRQGW